MNALPWPDYWVNLPHRGRLETMSSHSNRAWLWLTLISVSFAALALGATFMSGLLNQHIAQSPVTWGLVASAGYIVFVVVVMALAIRPFAQHDEMKDR